MNRPWIGLPPLSAGHAPVLAAVGLPGMLVAAFAVYWPGLSGPFLLDDYANLPVLGALGGVDNLATLVEYLRGGIAGPTGRPLSLLSFLIDHNDWPAPARDFKYTGVLIHLVNGCLLFGLVLQLSRADGRSDRTAAGLALFVAAGWLLHPLLVSTTLYVVQRMAMLAATAVFAGLLGYVVARRGLDSSPGRALFGMAASIGVAGALGVLAKENAALIVPLALVLEATLLPPARQGQQMLRWWRALALVLPTVLLLAYLGHKGWQGLDGGGSRGFDSLERLMTQARILVEYLYYWFIPQAGTPGLLNTGVEVSRGLLRPATTLPCVLLLAALIAAAVAYRRRHPHFAAAFGFFFVGHLLESTTISLELYFEHRNYLPAALLWLPIGAAAVRFSRPRHPWWLALVVIPLLLAPITALRSSTWGNAQLLALTWVRENPGSQRAYRTAALMLERAGRPFAALQLVDTGRQRLPQSPALLLHAATLECRLGKPEPQLLAKLADRAGTMRYGLDQYHLFEHFVELGTDSTCARMGPDYVRGVLVSLLRQVPSEGTSTRRHQLEHLLGLTALRSGAACEGYRWFRRSIESASLRDSILLQSALLATMGYHAEALEHLDSLDTDDARADRWARLRPDSPQSAAHLRRQIRKNMNEGEVADPTCESSPGASSPPASERRPRAVVAAGPRGYSSGRTVRALICSDIRPPKNVRAPARISTDVPVVKL